MLENAAYCPAGTDIYIPIATHEDRPQGDRAGSTSLIGSVALSDQEIGLSSV
jgi:hypothetical protein